MLRKLLRAGLVLAIPVIGILFVQTRHPSLMQLFVLVAIVTIVTDLVPKLWQALKGAWKGTWTETRMFVFETAKIVLIILGAGILIPEILANLPPGGITNIARNIWSELIAVIEQMF